MYSLTYSVIPEYLPAGQSQSESIAGLVHHIKHGQTQAVYVPLEKIMHGKYFIMGNGKDVFAVPSQREAKNRQSIKEQLDDVRRSRNETGPEKQAPKSWER